MLRKLFTMLSGRRVVDMSVSLEDFIVEEKSRQLSMAAQYCAFRTRAMAGEIDLIPEMSAINDALDYTGQVEVADIIAHEYMAKA